MKKTNTTELIIPAGLFSFRKHPSITKDQTVKYIQQAINWFAVKGDEFFQKIPNTNLYAINKCFSIKYIYDFTEAPFKVRIEGFFDANCEKNYPFGGFTQASDSLPYLLQNCSYAEVNYVDIARRSNSIAIRIFVDEESEDCNMLDWAMERYIVNEKIGGYTCRGTSWDRG